MVNKLTHKVISNFSHKFNKNKTNKIVKNINTKTDFINVLLKTDYTQDKKKTYTNIIDIQSKISDQKLSGRCWIFAFLNIIRYKMIKKYKLTPDFEFSQNYLFFFDKLEKANFYLSYIIDTYDVSVDTIQSSDKLVKLVHILDNLTDDGGCWNVFVNLIEKYGIVPKTNMDDNFHSTNSEELKNFYNDFLRKCAHKIKTTPKNELIKNRSTILNNFLSECYKILVVFLGEPPIRITWEYYEETKSKPKKAKIIKNISPLDFYKKYVPYCAKNKVCLINYPCKETPFFKHYDIEMSFDVLGEKRRGLINAPISFLIDATKKSIANNEAVWIGLDIEKYISHKNSFMDKEAFDYDSIFGFNNAMNKCDALNYRQTAPVHAMVIKGYNLNNSKTNGFLVENSWGDKIFEKEGKEENIEYDGTYYMSESWFKDFTFEIVVDKKYVPKKLLSIINQTPIILPYWSPFGALLQKKINNNYA